MADKWVGHKLLEMLEEGEQPVSQVLEKLEIDLLGLVETKFLLFCYDTQIIFYHEGDEEYLRLCD